MKIGLFGGSFNPIHNAHVSLAQTIRKETGLDEVWFLVSPHNPLKQSSALIDEDVRLEMVRIALEGREGLVASDYEFRLPRPSYTWNTLQHLRQDFPDNEFSIIIGGDNWKLFHKWAHYEDILRDYPVIVYPRSESDIDSATLPDTVHLVNTPKMDVTSTMIREMIAQGEDFSSFVDPKVAEFIVQGKLYQN